MAQINWIPIVGIIVGFLLSQVANLFAWILSERRHKKLIRILVILEINQNLSLLNDYWHNVSLPPDEEEESDALKIKEPEAERFARRALEIPLPSLSDKGFNSQLSSLPKVLNAKEMRMVWGIYEQLGQIQTFHKQLLNVAVNEKTSTSTAFPSASRAIRSEGLTSATFRTKQTAAIYDLRKTIQDLLKGGNPLDELRPISS